MINRSCLLMMFRMVRLGIKFIFQKKFNHFLLGKIHELQTYHRAEVFIKFFALQKVTDLKINFKHLYFNTLKIYFGGQQQDLSP